MKKGFVLEGGAMRGLFSAGVMDVLMENNIWPDGVIGVSAGAAFGCNMKSKQAGRAAYENGDGMIPYGIIIIAAAIVMVFWRKAMCSFNGKQTELGSCTQWD